MLSKCANPGCSASFLYLHQGKLFRLETNGNGEFQEGSRSYDPTTFYGPESGLKNLRGWRSPQGTLFSIVLHDSQQTQPRCGARMQPTASAVGNQENGRSPNGAKEISCCIGGSFCRPFGALLWFTNTHGLRRGLQSSAASRLPSSRLFSSRLPSSRIPSGVRCSVFSGQGIPANFQHLNHHAGAIAKRTDACASAVRPGHWDFRHFESVFFCQVE